MAWIPRCERVDLPDVNHFTMVLHDDPPVITPMLEFLDRALARAEDQPSREECLIR